MTWQPGVTIGASMTRIFGLFVSPMFLHSHGARFIVSCGFDRILAPQQANHPHSGLHQVLEGRPIVEFPSVFASNFTVVWFAPAAISNIPALSATVITWAQLVIFVPQGVTQASPPTNNPCLPKQNLPTPVRADRFIFLLDGYDHSTVEFLGFGFTDGFPIHFKGDFTAIDSKNLASAIQQPSVVEAKLVKEIEAGRIAGPFLAPPFAQFRVSPLGVVPKKVPGEFRLIHHLSYPKGLSVNDSIPNEYTSVSYANIEDAI